MFCARTRDVKPSMPETLGSGIRAKTGHLRHVASLSGVLPWEDGGWLAFSILVNGARAGRTDVDSAIDSFVGKLRGSVAQRTSDD